MAVRIFLLAIWTALFLLQVPQSPTRADETPAETKKAALEWLDAFAKRQVLFHPDDVRKLRARVEAMTPEEAAAWWEEKAPQREALSSEEWLQTETWLREFLRVQAIYDDKEIRDFQIEAAAEAKDSAPGLEEVLGRVIEARRKLVGGAQAAEDMRKAQLAVNEAYRKEQVRQREEARRQAAAKPARPITPPPVVRDRPTRYSAPLIDSLDVARRAVVRGVFPRW